MLAPLLLVALAATPSEAASVQSFAAAHGAAPEALAVVPGADGRALSVIGHFDVGLDAHRARDARGALDAALEFVARQPAAFGLDAPYALELRPTRIAPVDARVHVVHAEQYASGLRLLDSEVTVAFHADGALHSVNGWLHEPARWQQRAGLAVEDAARRLAPLADLADGWQRQADAPGESYVNAKGQVLERALDPRARTVVWLLRAPSAEWRLDEATLAVRRIDTDDPVRGTCNVRHADFTRNASGQATGLTQGSLSGTAVETPTCEAVSFWFNDCYWQLKLDEAFTPHALGRIDDTADNETEVHVACDATPSFSSSGGDFLQQQTAYVALQGMRHFMLDNVWNRVAPNRDSKVDTHMDSDQTASAFFRDTVLGREIHVGPALSGAPDAYWHEYGHYVVWTYDDVSNTCVTGQDEGNALDETLANVFALLGAVDDPDVRPTYTALSGFANGQAPSAHTGSADRLVFGTCAGDDHQVGVAFEQALWELMWNRDCFSTTCPNPVTFGNTVFPGDSQETVLKSVGEALGFALKVLGQNITFAQVAAQMRDKVRQEHSVTDAARFGSVLAHHGF
jgi:hypothetical protein